MTPDEQRQFLALGQQVLASQRFSVLMPTRCT
jgi:hypothetical protein